MYNKKNNDFKRGLSGYTHDRLEVESLAGTQVAETRLLNSMTSSRPTMNQALPTSFDLAQDHTLYSAACTRRLVREIIGITQSLSKHSMLSLFYVSMQSPGIPI